ncbi:MAG: hypothetical protein ACRYG7_00475 [Janthinobacterium lividum]
MQRSLGPTILAGMLLASCAADGPTQEASQPAAKRYNLGAVSVQLPAGWKALDYDSAGLWGAGQGPAYRHRHLFINSASPDTVLRPSMVFTVEKRAGSFHANQAAQGLAKRLRASSGQLQALTLRDTLLANGQLAIIEANYHSRAVHLDVLQTYAFYTRANVLVAFLGTARSNPGPANQQTRALFRQAITSLTWR